MKTSLILLTTYLLVTSLVYGLMGEYALWGVTWKDYTFLKMFLYFVFMGHITISAMSLSFHRSHSHGGVKFNGVIDFLMQTWLWLVTGMSKLDWCSIHLYHHAHSDQEKDPHSPVKKGFLRVFFLGVADYTSAKEIPAVKRIKGRLPVNGYEKFYDKHSLLGIGILTALMIIAFGPFYGSILSLLNFSISPLFAVGGVNAVAHMIGYRNHSTTDNSRNIGFLFLLNWIICGELDHNNHHAQARSCSFRHRWYEFDIGYVYIKLLSWCKLAEVKSVYRPVNLKEQFKKQLLNFLETEEISKKIEKLAKEANSSYEELKAELIAKINGEKKKLEPILEGVMAELKQKLREVRQFQPA